MVHSKTTNEAPPQHWIPEAASKKLKASLGREFIKSEFLKMYQKQSRSRSTLRTTTDFPYLLRNEGWEGGDESGGTIVDVFKHLLLFNPILNRPTTDSEENPGKIKPSDKRS